MPVTHGSASKSSDLEVPFTWTPPAPRELDAAETAEGSVLSIALRRARDEHRNPRPVQAGFDNKVALDDEPSEETPPGSALGHAGAGPRRPRHLVPGFDNRS